MSIDPLSTRRRHRRQTTKESSQLSPQKINKIFYWIGGAVACLAVLLLVSSFFLGEKLEAPSSAPTRNAPAPETVVRPSAGVILSVSIDPSTASPGIRLRAIVQPESGLSGELAYQWYCNDQPIDGAVGGELDTTSFARNDAIAVGVTRYVDAAEQESIRSLPVLLRNRPPVIEPGSFGKVVDGNYVNGVHATDPDGDLITFSLEQAPSDMTIDAETGLIVWPLQNGVQGNFEFQIVASDGISAALQQMRISLGGAP